MGSLASLLVLMSFSPPSTSLLATRLMRGAIAEIATWVFFPSFALTLVAGMMAIAANRAFHNAGWAWVKLATGILVFAGSFQVLAPSRTKPSEATGALAGQSDPDAGHRVVGEQSALWVLLAVSTANVVLGVWRPRLTQTRGHRMKAPRQPDPFRDLDVSEWKRGLTSKPHGRKGKDMLSTLFVILLSMPDEVRGLLPVDVVELSSTRTKRARSLGEGVG